MNWKKRNKLRKKLHHYQSRRVKFMIRLMNELNAAPGKYVSAKTRALFIKFCKQHPLHDYDAIVRKKAIRKKPELPSIQTRNRRVYDYNCFMNAVNDDKRIATLMESHKWRGELDHPVHGDLAQNPDVTTKARIGISPKGDVKFYGFDICKT